MYGQYKSKLQATSTKTDSHGARKTNMLAYPSHSLSCIKEWPIFQRVKDTVFTLGCQAFIHLQQTVKQSISPTETTEPWQTPGEGRGGSAYERAGDARRLA